MSGEQDPLIKGKEQPKPTFADVPHDKLREVISLCTGYNIFSADSLLESGIPESIVKPLVYINETSMKSPTSTIFSRDGGVLGAAIGVYDMHLLDKICRDLGVDRDTGYFGRGSQVRALKERLDKHFDQQVPPVFK